MTQPAPPVDDPALAGLDFEQLAQLVEGQNPDALYQQAAAFDSALMRYHDIFAEIVRESRQVSELWDGQIAEAFDSFAAELTGGVDKMVQTMESPGHGVLLRRAGDALTVAQQRFRELRAQPGHEADNRPALQIVHDLSAAYQEAGGAMPLPPEFVRRLPGATADAQGVQGGGAAAGGASPVLATVDPAASADAAVHAQGDWAAAGAGHAFGVAGAMMVSSAPGGGSSTTMGAVGGGVGGYTGHGTPVLGRSAPMAAQAAHQPVGRADTARGPMGGGLVGALGRGRPDKKRERERQTFAVQQEDAAATPGTVEDARQRAAGVSTTSSLPDGVDTKSSAASESGIAIPVVASPAPASGPAVATASAGSTAPAGTAVPGPSQPSAVAPGSGSSGSGGTTAPLSLSSGSTTISSVPAAPAGGGTPAVPPVSRLDATLPVTPVPPPAGPPAPAAIGHGAPMMPMGMMGRGMGAESGAEGRDPDIPVGAAPEVWDSGAGAAVLGRRPKEEIPPAPDDGADTNEFTPGWLSSGRIDGRKS
ncbi:hypothetical protein CFP71_20465 [Amycolatopsis thailandensis]|uniref:Uncharacterized protein n=1 Tax=Amycolatopsis thailandensis TaxID=589330 RepID=A0A229S505_9PSEU|nr:WXG100 family type VII secretion target [Amycolatopsis thailandensis]OXM54007.1 hypothetical protein CFP71_20465 [Amycolatopsis thailandensis]